MQMSNLYMSTNKRVRAAQLRRDAMVLQRAGFQDSADQNLQLADELCPTPREESQSHPQRNDVRDTREGKNGSNRSDGVRESGANVAGGDTASTAVVARLAQQRFQQQRFQGLPTGRAGRSPNAPRGRNPIHAAKRATTA